MSEDFINNFNGNRVACVGTNDGISEELFPEGYETAIDMLFKEVFNKGFFEEDLLVYPLCFLIRHYLELELKILITSLEKFLKKNPSKLYTHSLSKLLSILNSYLPIYNTLPVNMQNFEKLINDFDKIDDNGETFRYKKDHNGNNNLDGKVDHINISSLYKVFQKALLEINGLKIQLNLLRLDTELGFYSEKIKLGYKDYYQIAVFFSGELTKEKINEIKTKYKLSSCKFRKIKDIIENTRSLSHFIGKEKKLEYYGYTFNQVIEFWEKAIKDEKPAPPIQIINFSDVDINSLTRKEEIRLPDAETFATIRALVDIGKDDTHPEFFNKLFDYYKKNSYANYCTSAHLGCYPYEALKFFYKGLLKCGQITDSAELKHRISQYPFED